MKSFFTLTKLGIIVFVLFSGLAGFALSHPVGQSFEMEQIIVLLVGLYFVSAGSFAINQAQEWRIDQLMPRTQKRPVPQGIVSPWQAYVLGGLFVAVGCLSLYILGEVTAFLAFITVVLYNGLYTMIWKKKWAFGAVPGAIPGALPVLIGYSANGSVFSPEALYLFILMFLWQMPHFWTLAIRFRGDYEKGGIPVLPAMLGVERTLYHMGLYVFAYVGVSLLAPFFFKTNVLFLFLVVPMSLKVGFEFIKYYRAMGQKNWLPFFLWTNFSVLVFLVTPVLDKWIFYSLH